MGQKLAKISPRYPTTAARRKRSMVVEEEEEHEKGEDEEENEDEKEETVGESKPVKSRISCTTTSCSVH
ncbi:unnamed protein product [Nippostrongylus brasiliensis]|uniref:Uncharacterized protein n=1 Tax=Nippostrongylus brasiliensis TaxID=27835 RepID=A0A0N4Y3I3_NIPBR|nr:unnamed protein product [Nippostrongylus brasiliensis]